MKRERVERLLYVSAIHNTNIPEPRDFWKLGVMKHKSKDARSDDQDTEDTGKTAKDADQSADNADRSAKDAEQPTLDQIAEDAAEDAEQMAQDATSVLGLQRRSMI